MQSIMKRLGSLLLVSVLGGAITLSVYKGFIEDTRTAAYQKSEISQPMIVPTSYTHIGHTSLEEAPDFVAAADQTVHAVVHVKNTSITTGASSIFDLFYGNKREEYRVGTGSGVIISEDGYIVTNNHVIENSKELEVVLNNNKSYPAQLVGADSNTDIALLKIDADEKLPYIAFGDSDAVQIGEWVLAVGNPFNLTSTVTAGIVSAKSRDLSEYDASNQSFIQTDAAVNPGNSGGALVNTRGELIGINTAITSQTGSFIGYSFAVPSNIARKVVEDILEYGDVQKGLLGISILNPRSQQARNLNLNEIEGVYIGSILEDSGAEKAGLKEGDIIKQVDRVKVKRFSDLTGYIDSKRPSDVVNVTFERNGELKTLPVTLAKPQTKMIPRLKIRIKNLSEKDRQKYEMEDGVKITAASRESLVGKVLLEINGERVEDIEDASRIIDGMGRYEEVYVVLMDEAGNKGRYYFTND